ncbi:MAG: hypothetical protein HOQ19_08330 [Gemmatimonadaceae bacterium]|nr:hypothetical protein [Gemmatimonadaceae bacterium]
MQLRNVAPFVLLVTGCASLAALAPSYPKYDLSLTSVQRPEKAKVRYGPDHIASFSDSGKTKYTFEDSLINATVVPIQTGFSVRIENKTSHTIKIIWDDAAIVDPTGQSARIMHVGVKYVDRNNSQPPTVIVARGHIYDELSPTDKVYMSTGLYGGWQTAPLLPKTPFQIANRDTVLAKLTETYKGKTVQLLLPLQIEDVTNDYLFTFTINDVTGALTLTNAPFGE